MRIDYRVAETSDVPAIAELIPISARGLRGTFYTSEQVDAAIGTVFGVDSQLIKDGTYFVAVAEGRIVGCGGWSKRMTAFGGDAAKNGEDLLRDPLREPAMIRAFFVHPDFARRGIGREIMRLSEAGAHEAGFREIEIVATLSGEPLYVSCGYSVIDRFAVDLRNDRSLPVIRMKRGSEPNKAPEPTPGLVTSRAIECASEMKRRNGDRDAARGAPSPGVAHL
jgi:GNAT superfamily N-acetyltransferase